MFHVISPQPLTRIVEHTNCTSPMGHPLCKAVVDIANSTMVIGAPFHADEEEFLLDNGSEQTNLWGINLYADHFGTPEFIEFDSMINLRPQQGNRSRSVENHEIRTRIITIVSTLIHA